MAIFCPWYMRGVDPLDNWTAAAPGAMRGAGRRVRRDFSHENERTTPTPQVGLCHPHGHDPQDRLASCPLEPPQLCRSVVPSIAVLRRAKEMSAALLLFLLRDNLSQGGAARMGGILTGAACSWFFPTSLTRLNFGDIIYLSDREDNACK